MGVVGPIAPEVKQRVVNSHAQSFYTVQNSIPTNDITIFIVALSTSIAIIKKIPHKHAQRLIFWVILGLIKLVIEINYHTRKRHTIKLAPG